ncbi:MHYT domain-containing protein [Roseisolibacter sp. H3M3-2]|uniref:sensor histidine kinase n=1 Tax=Roseisolibacter sp. H3M3-2 TaxID=3031323 RepID=UPI0023DA6F13|nr:MHYT domain-containing protein [Roseisolibacter sp. H3M3-2]MDF1505532.1 MHYT domain-containing protein [Roseisolibacter sp. H3M3-2]
MERHYDPWLVGLSLLVAAVAGYVALDLAGRVNVARGAARRLWIGAGALAMGTGIWSMHFIGMLAFRLRDRGAALPMTYDVPHLVLSVLVAVAASFLALAVAGRERLPAVRLAAASVAMGAAIAGMHYIGMAGLRVSSRLHHDPPRVAASLAIAVAASSAALWLAYRLRAAEGASGMRRRGAAALLIGVAIAGMHYTAMSAARFGPAGGALAVPADAVLATQGLGWAVTGTTGLILALALAGTAVDRELRARLARAQEVQRLYAAADAARAEAERANRAKDDFLATMSHELRTPLNAILGYADLLDAGVAGDITEQQRAYLARVRVSGRYLLGLITDVLDFARIESGRAEYDVRAVHTGALARDVVQLLAPQFAARRLTLDVAVGDDAPSVCADRDKLARILVNLLSNAAKFTAPGGRVAIRATADDGTAALVVEDSGIGIPAGQLEAIFEPFVQVGRSLSNPGEGTGLGLAISRQLARGMGGELVAESAPGAGSRFTVLLPRADVG